MIHSGRSKSKLIYHEVRKSGFFSLQSRASITDDVRVTHHPVSLRCYLVNYKKVTSLYRVSFVIVYLFTLILNDYIQTHYKFESNSVF